MQENLSMWTEQAKNIQSVYTHSNPQNHSSPADQNLVFLQLNTSWEPTSGLEWIISKLPFYFFRNNVSGYTLNMAIRSIYTRFTEAKSIYLLYTALF